MDEAEQRRRYRANIPAERQGGVYVKAWDKAMTGRAKTAAIKAKCLDCCCWEAKEIRDCRVPACPLYPYRPYR